MFHLLPYHLWVFHGKQSLCALGIVFLNLQPHHRTAAHVTLPQKAHGSGPHSFLDLDAEEPFLRRNPTLDCTPPWHALQTYPNGNIAPFATIKINQAPTAQTWLPNQSIYQRGS